MGFGEGEASIRPRRLREGLRLSPNEERYLLAESLTNQIYAAPAAVRLIGPLDPDALEAALKATCDRHEARRTGFELGENGRFTKYVEETSTMVMTRLDMPGASEDELREIVRGYCYLKGDYTPESLHRYLLIKLGENDYVFAFALHHATSDGVTFQAFSAEVHARRMGFPIPETPASQYGDYWNFDWENSDAYKAAEAFWMKHFEGVDEVAAWPADLATGAFDRSRPSVSVALEPEAVAATNAAAQAIGVTPFSFFYAAYAVLLSRMTGVDAVCTTFQSAGRRTIGADNGAHGVFSNALLMATRIDERESIAALAGRMRGDIREAIRHEILPYHHLVRNTGLQARYAINWFPEVVNITLNDVEIQTLNLAENQDDDDLNVRVVTYQQQTRLAIYYKASAFSAERVQAVAETLAAFAVELAKDIDRPVGEVRTADLAPPGVLPDPTAVLPAGGGELIQSRFLARARAHPRALALEHEGGRVTYGELARRSACLGQALRRAGVSPGERVAILAERGPELVTAMLGAARAGAVFAVLDAGDPEARLMSLLDICAPAALVHTGGAPKAVAERLAGIRGVPVVDAAARHADGGDEGLDTARPESPAYFLFTSGSTGKPKCVAASHQPLAHFTDWQARTFGLTAADRFALLSGLSHDPLLRDVFTPLSIGAALVIPDAATRQEPSALAPWLRKRRVGVAHITPPLGQVIVAGAAKARTLPDLRRVFWGGDELRPQLARDLAALAPNAEQVNFYGATETPQAVAFHRLDPSVPWRSAPLGTGSEGAQLFVVGADRRPLGVGEVGEIAVRSNWLSLGYVEAGRILPPGDRGLDAEGRANIYFTGDRGLHLPDGQVLFVGRADDQLKIRGHRVDLSEVAAALLACPGVRTAVALPVGTGDDARLAAFVTVGRGVREPEIRTLLAARLPTYMVPASIRFVDALPLLANGKIDRKALLALPEAPASVGPSRRATPVELQLIEAWSSILGGDITPDSSFASLGGDSLSYVQAYLATEEVIGEAPAGWRLMSISELAALKTAPNTAWSVIDTPIALRAAAIILVVAGHYHLFGGPAALAGMATGAQAVAAAVANRMGGGATSALMLISGFMMGGLALQQAFRQESAQPLFRTLWSIFVPTAALSFLIFLARLPGDPPEPYIYLLTADFQDYSRLLAEHKGGDNYLWYVDCLLHMLLMLYLAVLALQVSGRFGVGRRRFLYGLFALACLGRFVLPAAFDPGFFSGFRNGFTVVNFLPTTHLATLLFGALIAGVETRRERWALAPVVLLYGLATAYFYGNGPGLFVFGASTLLLAMPRIRTPRFAAPVVFALAGASLWIYLSHMVLRDAFEAVGLVGQPAVTTAIALGLGVAFWTVWSKGVGFVNRTLRRPLALQPDAAV